MNRAKVGSSARIPIAKTAPQFVTEEGSANERSASATVSRIVQVDQWGKEIVPAPVKAKIAAVSRAGLISGRMTRKNMPALLHPSIWAASSISMGMPRMNWTIMKTKNGLPKNRGRMRGI